MTRTIIVEDARGNRHVAYPCKKLDIDSTPPILRDYFVVDGIDYTADEFWRMFRQVTR